MEACTGPRRESGRRCGAREGSVPTGPAATAMAAGAAHSSSATKAARRMCLKDCGEEMLVNFVVATNFVTPSARSRTSTKSTGPRRPTPDERWRLFARSLRLPAVGARLAAHGAGQQPRRLCAARLPPGFRRARPHTVSRAQAVHTLSRKNACPRVQTAQRSVARPRPVARLPPQRGGLWSRARGGSGERRQRAAVGRGRLRRAGAT